MGVRGRIEVSESYCKGCELCRAACPPGVIDLDTTRRSAKGYHPAYLARPGCTGLRGVRPGVPGGGHHRLPHPAGAGEVADA